MVIKTAWYSPKKVDQWNQTENADIIPHIYGSWFLTKKPKLQTQEVATPLTDSAGQRRGLHADAQKEIHAHHPAQNSTPNGARTSAQDQCPESSGKDGRKQAWTQVFLIRTPTVNKWKLMKLKSICKQHGHWAKPQPTEREKVFNSYVSDRGLESRIYKEPTNNSTPKNPEHQENNLKMEYQTKI